jgi:hypothetical protein
VQAPSLAWIESCSSDDIVQHLVNLRYHLLNDALNIKKSSSHDDEEVEVLTRENEPTVGNTADEPMIVQ